MALHPDFSNSPHAILDPAIRWFPADEALRDTTMDKLMPPLVAQLRRKGKQFRDGVGAAEPSKSLLNWWFNTPHLLPQADGTMAEFQYFFAQREAIETIVYLIDVAGVKDKFDLMRFDGSGKVRPATKHQVAAFDIRTLRRLKTTHSQRRMTARPLSSGKGTAHS